MLADALQRHLSRRPLLAAGVMSGTSLDGVDVALLSITDPLQPARWTLLRYACDPFESVAPERLRAVAAGEPTDAGELSRLRMALTRDYARIVRRLCEAQGVEPTQLAYVAAHGVTLWHAPGPGRGRGVGHTWQLHAGPALAAWLRTIVVDDFRTADVALGGQGAPLAPVCDLRLRGSAEEDRVILNLGGVANLTALPAGATRTVEVRAGDVGPANLLLDELRRRQTQGAQHFDRDGAVGLAGRPDLRLVHEMLAQGWARQPLPRSFGREQFGMLYVDGFLAQAAQLSPADQMATAVAVEAAAVRIFLTEVCGPWRRRPDRPLGFYLTGGGRHNRALTVALERELAPARAAGIEELGTPADIKEAVDFALLGWLALSAQSAQAAPITGAARDVVLGAIHAPDLQW
jgi:anhydro-N-acetylmuramic acid kinase